MRRFWIPALLVLAAFAAVACGDDDDDTGTGNGASPTAAETPAEEPTPTPEATTPAENGDDGDDDGEDNGENGDDEDDIVEEPGFEATYPGAWYVLPLTQGYADDPDRLDQVVEQTAEATQMDASTIRLQTERLLDRQFDEAAMLFVDPMNEVGLPVIDVLWCLPDSEPTDAQSFLTQLEEAGGSGEISGTVTHDDTEYDVVEFSRDLQPELTHWRTWVDDDGCMVESQLTESTDGEEPPPIEIWQEFVGTLDIEMDDDDDNGENGDDDGADDPDDDDDDNGTDDPGDDDG